MKRLQQTHRDHSTVSRSPMLQEWEDLPPRDRARLGWEPEDWADPWLNAGMRLPVVQRWYRPLIRANQIMVVLTAAIAIATAIAIVHRPYPLIVLVRTDGTLTCPPARAANQAQSADCRQLLEIGSWKP